MTRVGLHVLLGPSLANISLLRLLLLLDIVSSSKLSHLFNSPWSLIQLSLGPLWGLAKVYLCLNIPVYPTHLEKTLNGIEAFWDFGCCLLYLCLRIIIFLNSKILLKSHDSTKMGTIAKESCQRPQWRLVSNDGYILSITASLACRGCILVLPRTYLPWILPLVIILDMRTIFIREFRNNTKTKDTSSIYVTRVETSRTTSSIFTNYTVSDIESLQRYVPALTIQLLTTMYFLLFSLQPTSTHSKIHYIYRKMCPKQYFVCSATNFKDPKQNLVRTSR